MDKSGIGRLKPVDLRTVWKREREDFTPWLVKPHNLALLGDALGLRLEAMGLETPVGRCRADIVCREADTGSPVVIEAQLSQTDTLHLGQVQLYASGLQASVAVWMAARFRDQHRVALDWMNRDGPTRYFGVEIEMWKIGTSEPAPKFNVVVRPGERVARAA